MTSARRLAGVAVALVLAVAMTAPATAAARPFVTGLTDPALQAFGETDVPGAFAAARAAGAGVIRVPVSWGNLARKRPASATDPADPAYYWRDVDVTVQQALAAGLQPILTVFGSTPWEAAPVGSPDPADFGAVMTAVARRYDGSAGRPRVRLFQLWNEPNLKSYLDQSGAASLYGEMLEAGYRSVHAVHDDNVVIAGGLGPLAGPDGAYGVGPLKFMRELLRKRRPFDVWSHHPYTSGGPAHRAEAKDDASMGDLAAVRRILRKTGHGRARFWVTEFSWDSGPPDPWGVPLREHARWVSEAFYRMWANGVSAVVWFQLRDNPRGTFTWGQTWQSGLYFRESDVYADARAKPALQAFSFPFVALPGRRRVTLWGRTPDSQPGRVVIERRDGLRWRKVKTLRADRDGIFRGATRRPSRMREFRARVGPVPSLGFEARRTRDRRVFPFGGSQLPPQGD